MPEYVPTGKLPDPLMISQDDAQRLESINHAARALTPPLVLLLSYRLGARESPGQIEKYMALSLFAPLRGSRPKRERWKCARGLALTVNDLIGCRRQSDRGPSSGECPRDGVPSEEPGRQGAKREAVSAPTSRQAEWKWGVLYAWGFSVSRAEPNMRRMSAWLSDTVRNPAPSSAFT
jgi:hypothetical protein